MKLTYEQIRSVAYGYQAYTQDENGIRLYRMRTQHAADIYAFNADWGKKAYSSAGVCLDFYTDSEYFRFSYDSAVEASSRTWYYFEVLVDGKSVALIGEYDITARCGTHTLQLPQGTHRVTLIFPNLFNARLQSVELSNGASLTPIAKKRKLAFYGDSITQGYDAKIPALCYVHRIGLQTGDEVFNLGIGGATFDVRLIDTQDTLQPDAVFVAYGTNDWKLEETKENLSKNVHAFLDTLRTIYPTQPIFVILPIWRENFQQPRTAGTLHDARNLLADIAGGYAGVRIIDLWKDVPQNLALFSDGLHPNEQGFAFYADGVYQQLKGVLL